MSNNFFLIKSKRGNHIEVTPKKGITGYITNKPKIYKESSKHVQFGP